MNDHHLKTREQVRAFLDGTQAVEFSLDSKAERYDFIRRSLIRFAYQRLSKPDKGLLLSFMTHVSGYSRIQVKRLTKTWLKRGQLQPRSSAGNGFTRKYTDADRRLLAELDELHGTLSGPATKKLCERAWRLFKLPGYQRLAGISVSHLYNMRRAKIYQRKFVASSIKHGQERPLLARGANHSPMASPVIFEWVHQGDLDGFKGLYHYAVDSI